MNLKGLYFSAKTLLGILHGSRAFGGPLQVILSLASKCNIKCIHCCYYSPLIQSPHVRRVNTEKELLNKQVNSNRAEDVQKKLIEELVSMNIQKYLFTGYGEFLLNKNSMAIMERVKKSGSNCILSTNGTLLTGDIIDKFIKIKIDELRITVMAGTAEMYLFTHPGVKEDMFYNLKENLLYLAKKKEERGTKKPKLSLVSIVISTNYNGLFDFAEFANSVKADEVLFHPFYDLDDDGLKKLVPSKEQSDYIRKELMKIKDYLDGKQVKHNIMYFLNGFQGRLDTTEIYRYSPCYYGWLSSRIDFTGNVYLCCHCDIPAGNIYENSFKEIWFGNAYREMRKEAFQINVRQTSVKGCSCNSCCNFIPNIKLYRLLNPLKGRALPVSNY